MICRQLLRKRFVLQSTDRRALISCVVQLAPHGPYRSLFVGSRTWSREKEMLINNNQLCSSLVSTAIYLSTDLFQIGTSALRTSASLINHNRSKPVEKTDAKIIRVSQTLTKSAPLALLIFPMMSASFRSFSERALIRTWKPS